VISSRNGISPLNYEVYRDEGKEYPTMSITAKCIVDHGTIKLPQSISLPDGMRVLVNIEPLLKNAQRKKIAQELAGSWGKDASIDLLFTEVEKERYAKYN
jgi:hypothetical protein